MGIIIKNGRPYKTIYKNVTSAGVCLVISTILTRYFGQTVYITDGVKTATGVFSNEGICVINGVDMNGEITIKVIVDGIEYTSTAIIQTDYEIEFNMPPKIYGVYWDGTADSAMRRTDAAADFPDPIAAINNGIGSSPFDNIYPWSEMKKVNDRKAGVLVKIPKFYFKWTVKGSTRGLQISPNPLEGFYTCPACADRGDGKGERDFIYIGRYHCVETTYKSLSKVRPKTSLGLSDFRNCITALADDIWVNDMMSYVTVCMLYLVEYANWNSQKMIGLGANLGTIENNGATDDMNYHTGTTAETRNSVGHVQYRYIEDIWANIGEYCDGAFINGYSDARLYIMKNPALIDPFSIDTYENTQVKSITYTGRNYIKNFGISTQPGLEWAIIPTETQGSSSSTYITDYVTGANWGGQQAILIGLGRADANEAAGLFRWDYNSIANGHNQTGARLMKLP